jgi:hypothetical protein
MAHRKSAVYLLLLPIFAIFSTHFAKPAKIYGGPNLTNRAGFLLTSSKKLQAVNEMHTTSCGDASTPTTSNFSITSSNIFGLGVTAITPISWIRRSGRDFLHTSRLDTRVPARFRNLVCTQARRSAAADANLH